MVPQRILLDLDGTLIDSRPGIIHSLRETLAAYGVTPDADHDYTWCIGASLWSIFEHYLQTSDRSMLDGAVAKYRHIYRDGPMFEYELYPGIVEALETLSQRGIRCVLATAKAHEYAREVVTSAPFAPYIAHVYGSELDGTNVQKTDLIRHILKQEMMVPVHCVMVGDRHHDIDGARANGVASVGVRYGYGRDGELSHASRLIDGAHELPNAIELL
jgi:phosphoglycolate phosphatase